MRFFLFSTIDLRNLLEISWKSAGDSESIQFDGVDDVVSWFESATDKCPSGMSLPTPTSYLELEAYADILNQVLKERIFVSYNLL